MIPEQKKKFYDVVRARLFGATLTQSQVVGMEAILDGHYAWYKGVGDPRWLAYELATSYHETAQTMQPVREAYWLSEEWRRTHLRYYPYYGRGFVQLTWLDNYRTMSPVVGIDLVAHPDDALLPPVAAKVMFHGMQNGSFTGRKLSQYFNDTNDNPVGARAIINGTDKADLIAGYHRIFLSALT